MGYRMSSWSTDNEILLLYSRGVSSLAVVSPVVVDQVEGVVMDQVVSGTCLKSTGYTMHALGMH